ncbi:hypothetical protein BY996DRAFT_6416590 [Phakopsora pachyrhizi]|nr:hypothetical protein BY996DRAFT_6416590 [Phakopsora pachyrhizi]
MDFVTSDQLKSALKSQDQKVELVNFQIDFRQKKIQSELDNLRKYLESRLEKFDDLNSSVIKLENVLENYEIENQLINNKSSLDLYQWKDKISATNIELEIIKQKLNKSDVKWREFHYFLKNQPDINKLSLQLQDRSNELESFNTFSGQIEEIKVDIAEKWILLNQFCITQQDLTQIKKEALSIELLKKDITKLKNSAVLRDNLDLVRLEGEVKEIPNQLCTLSHLIEDVRADFVGKQFAIEEQLKYYQDNDQIDLLRNKFNDLKSSVVLKDNPDLVKLEVESVRI